MHRTQLLTSLNPGCVPSDIGPIPDNQEVWVDGDKSLIIEIVEFRAELLEEEVGR